MATSCLRVCGAWSGTVAFAPQSIHHRLRARNTARRLRHLLLLYVRWCSSLTRGGSWQGQRDWYWVSVPQRGHGCGERVGMGYMRRYVPVTMACGCVVCAMWAAKSRASVSLSATTTMRWWWCGDPGRRASVMPLRSSAWVDMVTSTDAITCGRPWVGRNSLRWRLRVRGGWPLRSTVWGRGAYSAGVSVVP